MACRWRALAARCQIAASEVGDHIDACEFGQQGRVVQLKRVAHCGLLLGRVAIKSQRAVAHGLPVSTDGGDVMRLQTTLLQQVVNHFGIVACNLVPRQGAEVQFIGAALVERHQCGFEGRIKSHKAVGSDLSLPVCIDAGQDAIGTIE